LITMEYIFKNLQREIFRKFLRQCSESEQVKDLLIEADEDTSL
jgi:mannitol/fructose-specific phosphotransferase system IIA component (Ntr-type)